MQRDMDSVGLKPSFVTSAVPSSNPVIGMWQGSGRPSTVGGFSRVLQFPPPRKITNAYICAPSRTRSKSFLCYQSKINNV